MSGDGSYAPKSPDLSSFYSTPSQAQAPAPAPAPTQLLTSAFTPGQQHLQPRPPQLSQSSQHQSLHLNPPQSYYQPSSPRRPPPVQPLQHSQQPSSTAYSPRSPQFYTPTTQIPRPPSLGAVPPYGVPPAQDPQYYQGYAEPQYQFPSQPQGYAPLPAHTAGPSFLPAQTPVEVKQELDDMPTRRSAKNAAPPEPAIEPSPVRTKFPTARIKRIMQADEEVGKVAQQTPIAVGKALELFMVALVTKSAEVAKEKNSRRVTAQMVKHVVETDEQWDFLREIVGKVDPEEKKGGRAKAEKSDSDSDSAGEPKKKGKGVRKKKG